MAFTLTEIQAAANDVLSYLKKKSPVGIWFEGDPFVYKLMGNGNMERDFIIPSVDMVENGLKIRVPLEYAEANYGDYGKDTIITAAKKTIVNAAQFTLGGIYASNSIDLEDQEATDGDLALVNLVETKLNNIIKTAKHRMAVALFSTGTLPGVQIYGLGNLFSTVTATAYGGIAEDEMSTWKANVTATAAEMTFTVLQAMRAQAEVGTGDMGIPNIYLTTRTLMDGYEATLQTQQQYRDEALKAVGFNNVLFGSVPVIADNNVTSGYCYGLNLNYLKFKAHKDRAFTEPKWEYERQAPDSFMANTRVRGQLVCYHRAAHVMRTNLTAPSA